MAKKKTKKRIRWDRIGIIFVVLIVTLLSVNWLISSLFVKSSIPGSQTISTDTTHTYNQPEKGSDGVYRIQNVVIVNKKYSLPAEYNPGENQEAVAQMKQMLTAMKSQKLKVLSEYAGYRSYETQQKLYEQYAAESGRGQADTFSARPGFSEHQTGLAFDIIDQNGELLQSKNDAQAVQWLQQHAYEYGFIVRYMKDKEDVTGYMYEEWHVRYLGKELAKKISDSKLSLEEYYNIEGGGYK